MRTAAPAGKMAAPEEGVVAAILERKQALRGQGGNGSAPRGEGRIIGVYTVLPLVTQGRVQLPMCCIATLCQHQRPTVLQLCVLRPTDCPAAARGVRTARART